MNGGKKTNGHGPDEDNSDEDNVVIIPSLAERDRQRREQEKKWRNIYRRRNREPLINLPPLTGFLLVLIILIHLMLVLLPSSFQFWVIYHFGFLPGKYSGQVDFDLGALTGPVTYMLLHGSWMHVIVNAVMLAAFGAGVEKWLGLRRTLIFMAGCTVISALAHFILSPMSVTPVIGASGAVSGLFAAAIVMLANGGLLPVGRYGILPLVVLWIVISAVFGSMGGPHGESVAWAAHIGGFLGGFLLLKIMLPRGIKFFSGNR
jgi:membrane associated rhomboid family serine protease